MIKKINEYFRKALAKLKSFKATLPERITIFRCKVWHQIYLIRTNAVQFVGSYWRYIAGGIGLLCFVASFYFCDEIHRSISLRYEIDTAFINSIKATLSNIGVSLICTSLVSLTLAMFGIQQSSEKLPHNFLQQIQKNKSVICLFASLFLIALFISILPIGIQLSNIACLLLSYFWLVVLYITLIAYTYKGVMQLISPIANLDTLVNSLEQKLKFWRTYFNRIVPKEAYPIIDTQPNNELKRPQGYLQQRPKIKESLGHLFYIAKRYARAGDIDISKYALNNALIKMNELYIRRKAGAFYADAIIAKNPLSNDEFFNETLEKLKQTFDDALTRNEDDFAIQSLQAFNQLVSCYADIEYKNDFLNSKPYAYIAFDILCRCLSLASSQKRIGIVLNGVRIIGAATQTLLAKSNLENIEKGIETISELSITALTTKESLPVVLVGVGQLSLLSKALIESNHFNIQEAAQFIKEAFGALAMGILMQTEKSMSPILLAPFFSYAEPNSLINYFQSILNIDLSINADQDIVKRYIKNFYLWFVADDGDFTNSFGHEKALLRLAVEIKSPLTMNLISWVAVLYKVTIHLSQNNEMLPSQTEIYQQELRKNEIELLLIIKHLKITKETAYFLEQNHLTTYLLEMLLFALQKGVSVMDDAIDVLLFWGVSSLSKRTLVKALQSLIVLNIEYGNEATTEQIKHMFIEHLMKNKNSWDVKELQKVKEILEASSFEAVGNFKDPNIRVYLDGIIKNNFAQASLVSKEFAKCIANVIKEKDPE